MTTNFTGKIVELKTHKALFKDLKIPTILSKEQRNVKVYAQILGERI